MIAGLSAAIVVKPDSISGSYDMEPDRSPHDAALEVLICVAYELLDAHHDVARLAADSGVAEDPAWAAHLEYVRGLQRVAREDLALAAVTAA